jgi:hypothetical protein
MTRAELERLDKSQLIEIIERQAQLLSRMEARILELEKLSVRSAAPFGRGTPSPDPKRPGRGKGHKGFWRERVADDQINERIDVSLTHCPQCGERLDAGRDKILEQTIIDIAPALPWVTRLLTHRNVCSCCKAKVASRHGLQVSRARGAAGTHLGPRALGLAASLSRGFGLTMRKTCAVLKEVAGLDLTPGGLSQALARMADRLEPESDALLAKLRASAVLHTDETSWWVGRSGYSLWVLTNGSATYYEVVDTRSKAKAAELLGGYKGVLVSDCLNIYDDLTPLQHKCYAHHLKAIRMASQAPASRDSPYLTDLRGLLLAAMVLKKTKPERDEKAFARMRQSLEHNADKLLTLKNYEHALDAASYEKVRLRLLKQRDHLFTFLDHQEVEATNNLAERQLRPAIISRKLSCGNKTDNGARAWARMTSHAATCRQNGLSFFDFVAARMPLAQPA